ncbi:MAG: hypothetical protein SFU86_15905 [Pirellulaceae bacterium]|nr:hypothetical protein [Pirellulaceae bacterium]
MRNFLWLLASVVCCTAVRADEFPFTAYVGTDRAEVASGPGRRFYTTDRLARGIEVEVYREDEAGWLAIRPPEGSFSWIPAEQVEFTAEADVGKVRAATPCWIGTNIERVAEHRTLVTLKAGELVQVLDRRSATDDDGTERTWLKIAPPAGEFRFIHGRDVSREPLPEPETPPVPRPVVAQAQPAAEPEPDEPLTVAETEPATAPMDESVESGEPRRFRTTGSPIALADLAQARTEPARSPADDDEARAAETSVEPAQFRSAVGQPSDRAASPDGFVPRKRRGSEQIPSVPAPSNSFTRSGTPTFSRPKLDPPDRLATSTVNPTATPRDTLAEANLAERAAGTPSSAIPSSEVARQLEQLELDLSLMLSQDRSTWDLAGLRGKVEQLVERGERPADRGQARLLLDKVRQFEQSFDVREFGPLASATPVPTATVAAAPSPADPRYDGIGWLKPVISKAKPAAPFALVDSDGKPLCFVTPSPGLNLSRYVNKQVGVYGKRGILEALKTPHVTAERVIDLDRHLR